MATKAKEDERKFILECIEVYRSLPALWNVKSKDYSNRIKKMNNTNICFANIERDFRMLIKINWLRNLIPCIITSEKNRSWYKILEKRWYWSTRRSRDNVIVFWRKEVSRRSGGTLYVAKYYSHRGRRRTRIWQALAWRDSISHSCIPFFNSWCNHF